MQTQFESIRLSAQTYERELRADAARVRAIRKSTSRANRIQDIFGLGSLSGSIAARARSWQRRERAEPRPARPAES